MNRRHLVSWFAVLLLAASGIASAQNAYASRPMNVRAGPNRDYPLVAQVDAGAPLDVHGCLDDWSWCDVSFEDNRGWVYAGGLSFVYQGERVPLYSYGPRLGLPIIAFSLGTYWGQYYRGRPWYAQRNTWAHRSLPPHMRPAGRPGMGAAPRPQGRPGSMAHGRPGSMAHGRPEPMPNAQRPSGGHMAPRTQERGRSGPPAGRAQPQRGHAGHPGGQAGSRGKSNHEEHGNRPPS